MSKELYVSSTPHETKVALVEDDQLAEIYFERENEYTLAGSIYKGRVTRVLPGMQSAFVNIGLERDAFLYVSDFFEIEDEDEQVESVNVARSHRQAVGAIEPPRPQNHVPHADGAPSMEITGGYEEGGEEAQAEGQGEESEEGARRWRGRRRRRGGRRGRGFPENKFENRGAAEPAAGGSEEVDEFVEGPVALPGESLSGHGRAEESRDEHEAVAEPSASPEAESESRGSDERTANGEQQPGRIVLPGESFTPRQPREGGERPPFREARRDRFGRGGGRFDRGGRGRDRDRGGRPERYDRGDRGPSHYTPPPAGYEPIILPGESLSKYKRPSEEAAPAASAIVHDEAPQETMQHGEPPVIEAPSFQQEYAETPVEHEPPAEHEIAAHESAEYQPESHAAAAETEAETETETETENPLSRSEAEPGGPPLSRSEAERQGGTTTEKRFRSMNVAEVFGGAAVDRESPAAHESEEAQPASHAAPAETETETRSHPEPVIGSFEEEEIEDEEAELSPYAEHFEDEDFEELEEETLEPIEYRGAESEGLPGEQLTEAIEETDTEAAAEEANEEEFESEEQEATAEGQEEGRAELRAPAGTAAYQQRAQRPQFDRRGQRGRRGGRRMRGGPRFEQRQPVMIADVLKEGQEVLVQIAKEPIGKKGARITSHIALPGRFLVYMPTVNHTGVSRKIASDEERQRLKRIVSEERENGHGGFIVRTAAENVREDELRADIRFLKNLWNEIKNRADNSKAPALIYHDLNLVERILRDLVTEDFTAIWSDNEQEYERILRFVNRFQPALVRRVKLYTKETPLYEQFGIQEEINKALKSKVWLKSGGYIVINQTEALVAIDVNTGKYVGKTQRLEDTIVKTNVDAIKEIVRQIRLRDLGGIIIIDFIDMDERKNRQKVMAALEDALRSDRSPSKVLQFNDFGLVAITRKRVKHSLERALGSACPYCTGTGYVKSVETVCNEIFIELKKMARHLEGRDIMLRVNPEVAKALKENNGRWISDYEELTGRTVIVKSDPAIHQEQFDMN